MRITIDVDNSDFCPHKSSNGYPQTIKRTQEAAFGAQDIYGRPMDESEDDKSPKSDVSIELGSQDTINDMDDAQKDEDLTEEDLDFISDEIEWDVSKMSPHLVYEKITELFNLERITLDDVLSLTGAYKNGERILMIPALKNEGEIRFTKRRKLN